MTGAGPTVTNQRITNLDAVRGIAALGILVMNAVSYGLPDAAYTNLDAAGTDTPLDWAIGIAGELFADQKMMGLFSMLFGAGIVLFAERAAQKVARPLLLSLWRNLLLFAIGVLHTLLWEGDILTVYAICSPFVLMARRLSDRSLVVVGSAMFVFSAALGVATQQTVQPSGVQLGSYWFVDGGSPSDAVELYLIGDYFLRALAMMFIGVALYRRGVVQGRAPVATYRAFVRWGLPIGLGLAAIGVTWQAVAEYSPDVALVGQVPNTLGTIPATLGYLGVITLWNARPDSGSRVRVRAVGRMALSNYLSQTVIGVLVLQGVLGDVDLTRTGIAVFVVAVWALQLGWSQPWLDRFRFGPVEWLWRSGTYRRWQPIRRTTPSPGSSPTRDRPV